MISLRITDNREDIRKWTGLPSDNYDEALWNVGFITGGGVAIGLMYDRMMRWRKR